MKHFEITSRITATICFIFVAILTGFSKPYYHNDNKSFIALDNTAEIDEYIDHLMDHPQAVEEMITRSFAYFPIMEEALQQAGLPDDLKYLSVIESSLWPYAKSEVGAVGLWQLMSPTAKELGLKVNKYVDERKDPKRSTLAAVTYLEKLYRQYEDWALCLAAYNTGPGNVNKAINKANSTDFEKIKSYLPKQTRKHVHKFVAVQYLFENYALFDLHPEMAELDRILTGQMVVEGGVKLTEIADEYDIDRALLELLNPNIQSNYIPNYKYGYELTVPKRMLIHNLNAQSPYQLHRMIVPQDMSIQRIAEVYQINAFVIRHFNCLNSMQVSKGQWLMIPMFNHNDVITFLEEEDPFIPHSVVVIEALEDLDIERHYAEARASFMVKAEEQLNWEMHSKR